MRNNLSFSKAVCLFALEKKARFINASSGATYGDGSLGFDDDLENMDELKRLKMYGYTKLLFDRWALREGCFKDIASLKFFNVYGPNEQHKGDMRSVANKAFHQIAKTGEMTLFRSCHPDYSDGGQMRDFVYIKDCCDIMWWLLQNGRVSGLFNVGTGKARSWNDLAAAVFSAMHLPADVRYVDMPEELAGKYQNFTEARMDRLKAAGYDAPMRSLEEGVADYVQNYLQTKDPYL